MGSYKRKSIQNEANAYSYPQVVSRWGSSPSWLR